MMELALSTTYFSNASNAGGILTFSSQMKSHHSLVQFDNTWNRLRLNLEKISEQSLHQSGGAERLDN